MQEICYKCDQPERQVGETHLELKIRAGAFHAQASGIRFMEYYVADEADYAHNPHAGNRDYINCDCGIIAEIEKETQKNTYGNNTIADYSDYPCAHYNISPVCFTRFRYLECQVK
jgi:hypothetical protein